MATIFITVISGVIILVLGQIIIKFILEPVLEFKNQLGEITQVFLRHQGEIFSAKTNKELGEKMFVFASMLLAKRQAITGYKFVSRLATLPSYNDVVDGAKELNLIGNLIQEGNSDGTQIFNALAQIEKHLKIKVTYTK